MKPMNMSENQRTLYLRACAQMAEQVPGWNDGFPSDPTLALLELGVNLSDLQNQIFDQIEDRHYLAYLKLLGTAPEKRRAAYFWAAPVERSGLYVGQRFWIDGVPFEVMNTGKDLGSIKKVSVRTGELWGTWDGTLPLTVQDGGAALRISFTAPLPAKKKIRIWCELLPESGRVPPDGKPPFPVTLCGYLPDGSGFPIWDSTCGLLRSGFLTFMLDKAASDIQIELKGELEGEPRISKLVLEPVLLLQRYTRSAMAEFARPFQLPRAWLDRKALRFFLSAGGGGWLEASEFSTGEDGSVTGWTGEPPEKIRVMAAEEDFMCDFSLCEVAEERIALDEDGILPRTLHVMVEEDGVWYDCPIREPHPKRTLLRGCRWNDEARELCFGDGRDFRVPKAGRLLVASCACTQGATGNGAGGELKQAGVHLAPLFPAVGGRDAQSPGETFLRTAKEWANLRAVSPADYRALAFKAPGLALEKVRVVTTKGEAGVTVLAKPKSKSGEKRPELTAWQTVRLREWLERFRMMGIPVTVRGPVYVPVNVSVSIRASEPVDKKALRRAAFYLTDGVTGPLDFGAEISYSKVFAALGAVPNVQAVEMMELYASAGGLRRNREGSVRLKPDMLPYLNDFRVAWE